MSFAAAASFQHFNRILPRVLLWKWGPVAQETVLNIAKINGRQALTAGHPSITVCHSRNLTQANMIPATKIQNCLNDFDTVLATYCAGVVGNGELHAMAGWVNQPCLDDLNQAISKYLVSGNKIRFVLAWIDKSPIAEYQPGGAGALVSGELADAAIIRLHVHSSGTAISQAGRMLLLQAKATKSNPPFVPSAIASGATPKEWAFMTSWPPFTLRAWGGSGPSHVSFDVMQGVAPADRVEKICQMSWFGVAPFYPAAKKQWAISPYASSPWWTAPPELGRHCDVALSKLLLKVALAAVPIDPLDNDGEAGRAFRFAVPAAVPPPIAAPLDWDHLANKIIEIAQRNFPAKEQIFATSRIIQFLTSGVRPHPTMSTPASGSSGLSTDDKPFPVIFIVHIE